MHFLFKIKYFNFHSYMRQEGNFTVFIMSGCLALGSFLDVLDEIIILYVPASEQRYLQRFDSVEYCSLYG
jgi:hypothetical protein